MDAILADDIFKRIFVNENIRISIQISLKFVSKSLIDNKSVLVQVMAWRRTGDKPLPEAMMTQFTAAYICHEGEMSWIRSRPYNPVIFEVYRYISLRLGDEYMGQPTKHHWFR